MPPDPDEHFRDTVATFGPALRRLCRSHERDPIRQEDLLQDILLALWRALPGFRGDASLRTFVFRVAHNTAISHATRAARQPQTDDLADHPAAAATAPPERLERRRLQAAVQALPVAQRQLIILYLEGLTSREIGAVTGLSPTNVTTRLSRLRQRLTDQLRRDNV